MRKTGRKSTCKCIHRYHP